MGMGMSSSSSSLFTSVQEPSSRIRWRSFAVSYIAQATAVTALVVYTVTVPAISPKSVAHVDLVAPTVQNTPKPARVKRTVSERTAPVRVELVRPKIEAPVLQLQQPQRLRRTPEIAEVAQPQITATPKLDPKVLNSLPAPKVASRIVATNTFGSSATPTLQKVSPSKVQTGGFGNPNGVAANSRGSNQPTIAATGAFDLPQGAGNGNGHGGASGIRGTVASAGFGNGVAAQPGNNRMPARVQTTSFSTTPVAPAPDSSHRAAHQPVTTPVAIQSKPIPVYTAEARQLRVEGEVLLNVVFTASGQIRVLNVVRGLGHGLDESAQRAAQGVKFSPAMRDGHPVDSNVMLHIIFQLS